LVLRLIRRSLLFQSLRFNSAQILPPAAHRIFDPDYSFVCLHPFGLLTRRNQVTACQAAPSVFAQALICLQFDQPGSTGRFLRQLGTITLYCNVVFARPFTRSSCPTWQNHRSSGLSANRAAKSRKLPPNNVRAILHRNVG